MGVLDELRKDCNISGAASEEELRQHIHDLHEVMELLLAAHDDQCWHDHHGYCQAHHLEAECSVKRARELLKQGKNLT